MLEKLTEYLLGKNGILALISFVIGVIVSLFVPAELYRHLPFDEKTSIIIGFVCIVLIIFLILYLITYTINKMFSKSQSSKLKQEYEIKQSERLIEEYRVFFDKISDEEYSIIMYIIKNKNQVPYKEWGCRSASYETSIFAPEIQRAWFYSTTSNEAGPEIEVTMTNGCTEKMRMLGSARLYTLKPDVYKLLEYIISTKGHLSHHNRKLVKLKDGNNMEDNNE